MISKVAYPVETHRLYHEVHKSLGKRVRQLRAPSLLDSSGFVPLLLLPALRQAGRDCSALSALFHVLVVVRFSSWPMMAELCISVVRFYFVFLEQFHQEAFCSFFFWDVALVHKYVHRRILGAG